MSDNKESDWTKREVGALWKTEGKNQSFYSGTINVGGENFKIVCFLNKHKKSNSHPDLRIYKSNDD